MNEFSKLGTAHLAYLVVGIACDMRLSVVERLAEIKRVLAEGPSKEPTLSEKLAAGRMVTPMGSSPASRFCAHNVALVEGCKDCQMFSQAKGLPNVGWRLRQVLVPDWVERVIWTAPPQVDAAAREKELRDAGSSGDDLRARDVGGSDDAASGDA